MFKELFAEWHYLVRSSIWTHLCAHFLRKLHCVIRSFILFYVCFFLSFFSQTYCYCFIVSLILERHDCEGFLISNKCTCRKQSVCHMTLVHRFEKKKNHNNETKRNMTKFEHFTKLPIIYGFDIYEYISLPLNKLVSCGWLIKFTEYANGEMK